MLRYVLYCLLFEASECHGLPSYLHSTDVCAVHLSFLLPVSENPVYMLAGNVAAKLHRCLVPLLAVWVVDVLAVTLHWPCAIMDNVMQFTGAAGQ